MKHCILIRSCVKALIVVGWFYVELEAVFLLTWLNWIIRALGALGVVDCQRYQTFLARCLTGVTCDGASVMSGHKSRVEIRLKVSQHITAEIKHFKYVHGQSRSLNDELTMLILINVNSF